MVEQQALFHDSYIDAIEATILALGGYKKVGSLLWPNKESGADTWLRDCLNPLRREKLDFEELATLRRLGRDAGCHAIAAYEAMKAGYEQPKPLDTERRARTLLDVMQQLQTKQAELNVQLADLLRSNPALLKAVA